MLYIGIDPGAKGGLVALNQKGQIVHALTFDNVPNISDYLIQFFDRAIKPFKHECTIYLEHSQSMPGQGVTGVFNYGCHFGMLQGTLYALGYPFTLIRPQFWTKSVFSHHKERLDGLEGKDRNLLVASILWPKETFLATKRSKVPHMGLVDASLIAFYAVTLGTSPHL